MNSYLEELLLGGLRQANTYVEQYRLRKLQRFLQEQGLRLQELCMHDAQGFQGWLLESRTSDGNTYSRGTVENFLKSAKRFYGFLKRRKLIHSNPFDDISRLRMPKQLPRNILKEKAMQALLQELAVYWFVDAEIRQVVKHYKVHVMCEIMYSTAMRIGEVAELEPQDINLVRKEISLQASKEGRDRLVFLNDYTCEVLRVYLQIIYPLLKLLYYHGSSKLFNARSIRLSQIANSDLEQISTRLKCGKVTCHSFRHAVGYHLLRAGCDIRYIQYFLGHKRIRNTEVYTKVEKDDLREKLDQYHPRKLHRGRK